MTYVAVNHSVTPRAAIAPRIAWAVGVTLAAWLAAVIVLAGRGGFVTPPGTPPLPIVLGVVIPLILFSAWWRLSASFREAVVSADLPLLTAVQAWRFAGFGFLALAAHGVLPAVFAWPAGLGDMAICLPAPWVRLVRTREPSGGTAKPARPRSRAQI